MKNKKIQETKLHAIPSFPAGSFAVHIGDHLRSKLGIICGAVDQPQRSMWLNVWERRTKLQIFLDPAKKKGKKISVIDTPV